MAYTFKKDKYYAVQSIIGAGLFLLGILLIFYTDSKTASYAMMSGGTLFGSGVLSLLILHFTRSPKEVDQESNESNDERNKVIRDKSAWATQRIMLIVLSVFVILVTYILPYDLMKIVVAWSLFIINAFLPYIFAFIFSRRY
ncbi:MAG: hypothetical protein ACRC3H_13170 [Lachnospiraceae bacterium]